MTIRALSTAATGMSAQMKNIDVIANNIANVGTTGFKKQVANFEDLFYQELNIAGGPAAAGGGAQVSPIGSQMGTGVRLAGTQRIFSIGSPKETQNALDVMIEGEGFFQVQYGDNAQAYTRAGSFKIDADGFIVTADGYRLEGDFTLPIETVSINISQDGVITANLADGTINEVGQIQLHRFINPAGLMALGDSLFMQTEASGPAQAGDPGTAALGLGILRQGFLEQSNVDVVTELVSMIEGQRAYEINANSIKAADEMLQVANNLRG